MDYPQLEKINTLLSLLLGAPVSCDLNTDQERLRLEISVPENDSGILIGYHGERIDALQLIVNLMWNQHAVVYTPVQVDINGYRQRRQLQLEDLANKAAEKAIESGREILLPHLPAFERRIIHVFLDAREDITTYSEGEGPERRLVVRPTHQAAE
jgi:spoIIIJ-associated protein